MNVSLMHARSKRRHQDSGGVKKAEAFQSSLLLASGAAALCDARRWLMSLCAILLTSSEIAFACFVSSSTVSFAWSQHNTIRGELQHDWR